MKYISMSRFSAGMKYLFALMLLPYLFMALFAASLHTEHRHGHCLISEHDVCYCIHNTCAFSTGNTQDHGSCAACAWEHGTVGLAEDYSPVSNSEIIALFDCLDSVIRTCSALIRLSSRAPPLS